MFDAISPQLASALPRCGVPRKTMSLVRSRHASDLHNACKRCQQHVRLNSGIALFCYVFDNDAAKAMGHEYDRILSFNKPFYSSPPTGVGSTSLSMSRSSRTFRSRPCPDTLFLLFAWKRPLMTSALYPYVHTLA